jgi:hypothetical protein
VLCVKRMQVERQGTVRILAGRRWCAVACRKISESGAKFGAIFSRIKSGAFFLTGTEACFLLHFFTLKLAKKG